MTIHFITQSQYVPIQKLNPLFMHYACCSPWSYGATQESQALCVTCCSPWCYGATQESQALHYMLFSMVLWCNTGVTTPVCYMLLSMVLWCNTGVISPPLHVVLSHMCAERRSHNGVGHVLLSWVLETERCLCRARQWLWADTRHLALQVYTEHTLAHLQNPIYRTHTGSLANSYNDSLVFRPSYRPVPKNFTCPGPSILHTVKWLTAGWWEGFDLVTTIQFFFLITYDSNWVAIDWECDCYLHRWTSGSLVPRPSIPNEVEGLVKLLRRMTSGGC